MKKMELFEEIVQLVKEELGVSDRVKAVTNDIKSLILKNKKGKPLFGNKRTGIIKDFDLFGKKTEIQYTVYYVNDESEIENLNLAILGSFNGKTNILKVILIYVRNKNKYIDPDGTLQHEVEHAFQESMGGKGLVTPKSANFYIKANTLASSNNIYMRLVGITLYLANKFEKDGKMNGLYQYIMDNWEKAPIDAVKETNIYKNISAIKEFLDNEDANAHAEIEDVCQKNFNRHYNWWKNMAKKVVSAYTNKIGKIIAKVEKDRQTDLIDHTDTIIPPKQK